MVIGVEGNVHVGKTTFINNNFKDYKIIKETTFAKDLNDFDRQLYYINEEIIKKNEATSKNIIMDRTLLSTSIYCFNSKKFNASEQKKLKDLINHYIENDKILIPDFIYYINYPFDLIYINHRKLSDKKGTQSNLIDYDYYLRYSLFFSNNMEYFMTIKNTMDFRQILQFDGKKLFDNIAHKKSIKPKVLLDGAPAIGKTTIGMAQNKYRYIEEFKYQAYTVEDYRNQLNSIIERINLLKEDNIIADTSFLMGITHLFYNNKTTKEFKLKIIRELINKVPLCIYITKIIYLSLDKSQLIKRKNNDLDKPRNHFYDNLDYLDQETNFYNIINKRLDFKSNIHILDASKSYEKLVKEIEAIQEKPLLLVDLFYCIYELIERGNL